jgi:hypothetical protein
MYPYHSEPTMATFAFFLRQLLHQGSARLAQPPRLHPAERDAALSVLRDAFRDHMLAVAGSSPPFNPTLALRSADWTAWLCWHMLHRGATPSPDIETTLPLFSPGTDAGDHATADVLLRLAASVHRRARAPDPRDALSIRLEELLRRWPLSGVLADIDEPPLTPLVFGGHSGLLLLYAERFAARPRPQWRANGPVGEYIELALAERNLS